MDSDFLWHCSCSTIGAIIMTPLLTKLLAGQLVPVDAAVSFFFYLLILCKKKKKPPFPIMKYTFIELLDYHNSWMII